MTQEQTILGMLRTRKPVTLGDLFDAGVGYTGRNRIGDLKKKSFVIAHKNGERPSLNAYILVAEPGEPMDQKRANALANDGWVWNS